MRKIGVIVITVCVLLAITISPIFATVTYSERYLIRANVDGGGGLYAYVTSLGPHLVNADIEYTDSNTYPTYTIYPTDSNGSHLTSISSRTTNSTGGSINLNSPTSTGSQSGRYTISDFTTTTSLYGFKAVPSGGSSSSTQHNFYVVQYDFLIYFRIYNNNNYVVDFNSSYFSFLPNFNFTTTPSLLGSSIEPLELHGIFIDSIDNDGSYIVGRDSDHSYNGKIILAPNESLYCQYKVSFYGMFTDSYNTDIPNVTGSFPAAPTSCSASDGPNPSYLYQFINLNNTLQLTYDDLHSFVQAYNNNQQNIANTNSQINSTQSTVDSVHEQEQQWYTQNQQAIEAAGLQNEKLTDSKYQGVYPVANDFSQLWTSIGPTKYIYLFALMASLAAFMLRHKPFSHAGKEINYQTKTLR